MRESIAASLRAFFTTLPGVAAVYLFGSVARGSDRTDSDVDLGVLFESAPARTLEGQPFDLADALEQRLMRPVDLVTLNTAPVDLRIRVLRDGELVYERNAPARIRFEVATRNEAFDLEPILREYRSARRST